MSSVNRAPPGRGVRDSGEGAPGRGPHSAWGTREGILDEVMSSCLNGESEFSQASCWMKSISVRGDSIFKGSHL